MCSEVCSQERKCIKKTVRRRSIVCKTFKKHWSSVKSMTETEFNSLLAAAAHRKSIDCPGWRPKSHANGGEQEFGRLHRCLSDRNLVNPAPIIHGLLNALADQMAALIGEHLTFLEFRRALESWPTKNYPAKSDGTSGP